MKVIYLTGAPGSGKTTALDGLLARMPDIADWRYSQRLSHHIERRLGAVLKHEELRRASATVVRPEDIASVDDALAAFVASSRLTQHVIIDSHPLTKETYGFRCTPFTLDRLASLALDEIWMTYVDPETTLLRINTERSGRQKITRDEAALHHSMQASLAIQYGIFSGCPVYFFDTSVPAPDVVDRMQMRLMK